MGRTVDFLFLLHYKLSCKYVGTFMPRGSKGSHICNIGYQSVVS